ncbi:MAG: HDIG domain-containing protein [Bacteroidaceae bacterium]|nr:HDIG domain-containing protein [Bacteroidaceae bacterium]
MNPLDIINKYYPEESELKEILLFHSRCVADMAIEIANKHPELDIDKDFVFEAAMLHDIGIFETNAPGIKCFGTEPYICHGTIGARILEAEGFPRHARVCERHTGTGLSLRQIIEQNLPVPHKDLLPETLEEQVICFADKFYSKSNLERVKTPEQALKSIRKFGDDGIERFENWCKMFL